MWRSLVKVTIGAFWLAGCSAKDAQTPQPLPTEEAQNSVESTAVPVAPQPRYEEHEGDRYLYVGAVSEEDQKQGKVVGDVLQYRYLGEKDGVLTLEQVTESGSTIAKLTCQRDCKIMKFVNGSYVSRIPYDPSSIAGSAMSDAINGLLESVRAPAEPERVATIPTRFQGVWQVRVADCGTALDDSVARVEDQRVSFYESSIKAQQIDILSPTRVKVAGLFGDESGESSQASFTLSLRGGKLEIDDTLARSRCPTT